MSDCSNDDKTWVFNLLTEDFERFHRTMSCEEVCTAMCRRNGIAPTAKLLYGIREHSMSRRPSPLVRLEHTWVLPGELLSSQLVYCFRMRFRVPEVDSQLEVIDMRSHAFLYAQMSYDFRNELISDIKYPEHKDKSMGLVIMKMQIDNLELPTAEQLAGFIEMNYKKYLTPSLWRAHNIFAGFKIREEFRNLSANSPSKELLQWHYVHQVSHMAPNYMTEQFSAKVQYLPDEDMPQGGGVFATGIDVYVRIFPHDSEEPGLKVARVTSEATLKWILLGAVEQIFMITITGDTKVRLELEGLPKGYELEIQNEKEMKSFISYLGIFIRLSTTWMQDLCDMHGTPSLVELGSLGCHGPIGGAYSLMKLHENGDKCYIIRQCDREYDIYYIDINTKIMGQNQQRCKTETFRIVRKESQWKLNYNNGEHTFNSLPELARFIQPDRPELFQLPASKFDKPPLLLLLLPKNLKPKKPYVQLSEAELQRRNPQIFNPQTDLQWYSDSISLGDDGMMFPMRGDWIQKGPVKDVSVTMKMLKSDGNFMEFFRLAQTWSLIQSPQFLKLYGLTLSDPYIMVMEYSHYGQLNKFLHSTRDVSLPCLLDLMHGLVRGMHYLEDNKILHSFIRCSNLYVTYYNREEGHLDAKISDPGYPRPYRESDSPWIPTKYYRNLQAAKKDLGTQLWAFATTIYEIFARCRTDLRLLKQEDLQRQRILDGNILPVLDPDICPLPIFETIMDGWSDNPRDRFRHHIIFSRLNKIEPVYEKLPEFTMNGTGDANDGENTGALPRHGPFPGAHIMPFPGAHIMQLNDCRVIYYMADQLGEGHYGKVFRGRLEFHDQTRPQEQVAIKTLHEGQVPSDFKKEVDIMRTLDHPNVVKFLYWAERSNSIVMEFLSESFDIYLRSRKPSLNNALLVGFALDIARGMQYLFDKKLIHRDLAARNILVDSSGGLDRVKISDFGLSRFANSDGYYLAQTVRELPILWYSPEAISTNKFSTYSDVWSYGVTLFEAFSRGDRPNLHPIQSTQDFLNRLNRGERLPRLPRPNIPDYMDELMRMCWHATPRCRPSFAYIVEFISRQVGLNVSPPVDQQPMQQLPPNTEGE